MGSVNILDMALNAAKTEAEKREIVFKYLEKKCDPGERKIIQDFPEGMYICLTHDSSSSANVVFSESSIYEVHLTPSAQTL